MSRAHFIARMPSVGHSHVEQPGCHEHEVDALQGQLTSRIGLGHGELTSTSSHWKQLRKNHWGELQRMQHETIEQQWEQLRYSRRSDLGFQEGTRFQEGARLGTASIHAATHHDAKPHPANSGAVLPISATPAALEPHSSNHEQSDEELLSLRQLAAPLVGLVGSALQCTAAASVAAATALKRRASNDAVAAADGAADGHDAAANAAATAFDTGPVTGLPPPPQLSGGTAIQNAAAEAESAEQALQQAIAPHVESLGKLRAALPRSALLRVDESTLVARERLQLVTRQLEESNASSVSASTIPGTDDASLANLAHCRCLSSVDACTALAQAREIRVLEAEATLRACQRRIDSLRSTKVEAEASLAGVQRTCTSRSIRDSTSEMHGPASSREVVAADRALKELDSTAAFELEQALWRGGLRGAALQARVESEIRALRDEWLDHRAKAEQSAIDAARRRSTQSLNLSLCETTSCPVLSGQNLCPVA